MKDFILENDIQSEDKQNDVQSEEQQNNTDLFKEEEANPEEELEQENNTETNSEAEYEAEPEEEPEVEQEFKPEVKLDAKPKKKKTEEQPEAKKIHNIIGTGVNYKDWDKLQEFDESEKVVLPKDENIGVDQRWLKDQLEEYERETIKRKEEQLDSLLHDIHPDKNAIDRHVRNYNMYNSYINDLKLGDQIKVEEKNLNTLKRKLPKGITFDAKTGKANYNVPKDTKKKYSKEQQEKIDKEYKAKLKQVYEYNELLSKHQNNKVTYNAAVEVFKILKEDNFNPKESEIIAKRYKEEYEKAKDAIPRFVKDSLDYKKTKLIQKYRDDLKKELEKDFNDKKIKKIADRESLELEDRKIWLEYVNAQKNAGRPPIVKSANQVEVYNKALLDAVNMAKNNPLDEVFMTGAFKKTADDSFDAKKLSDKDLRDAEQVFDRIFIGVEAFYNRNKVDESVLKNTQFVNSNIKELSPEEAGQLKGKSVLEVVEKVLDKNGIKKDEISPDKFSQYAKAFYLYSIGHQNVQLKFVPNIYTMGEDGAVKQSAENDERYCIETQKIILANSAEAQEKIAYTNRANAPRYKRVKASEMRLMYPIKHESALDITIEEIIDDPEEEEKFEQEELEEQRKIQAEKEKAEREERERLKRLEEERNRKEVEEQLREEARIKAERRYQEGLNPKVDISEVNLRDLEIYYRDEIGDFGQDLNLSIVEEYINGIAKLAKNIPEFAASGASLDIYIATYNQVKTRNIDAINETTAKGYKELKTSYEEMMASARRVYAVAKAISTKMELYFEAHTKKGDVLKVNQDLFNLIEGHANLMINNDMASMLGIDTTYKVSYDALMKNFPTNLFKDQEGNFRADNDRYNDMMERLPIIKNLLDRQKFYNDNKAIIQNIRAKNVDSSEIKQFTSNYIKFANSLKADYRKLKNVKLEEDNDIRSINAYTDDPKTNYLDNYAGANNGDIVIKNINRQLHYMDLGWPLEDTAFLLELGNVVADLGRMARGEMNVNQVQKRNAELAHKKIKEQLERIQKSIVTSEEMRDEILESLREPLSTYNQIWREKHHNATSRVWNLFDDAVNRRIVDAHLSGADHRIADTVSSEIEPFYLGEEQNAPRVRVELKKPGLTNQMIKDNVDLMVEDMAAVEFRFRKGSNEFVDMKNALLRLKAFVNGPMNDRLKITEKPNGDIDTFADVYGERVNEIREHLKDAIRNTKAYLAHKQRDLHNNDNRRNSRERNEQPRIKMAINQLEKLNFILGAFDDLDKARAIERIDQKIADETINLRDAKNKNDYVKAASRILTLAAQKNDFNLEPKENETEERYRERLESLGKEDLSVLDIKSIMGRDDVLKNLVKNLEPNYDNEGLRITSADQLISSYNEAQNGQAKTVNALKKKRDNEVNVYKESLVSDARKQVAQNRKNVKNNVPNLH